MSRFLFIFGFLFFLHFISYGCKGRITSPPDGTKYVFLPGKTAKIKWEFDDDISAVRFRDWTFTSSDGSLIETFASILGNGSTDILTKSFEVDIERPATLVLKNVNQRYNGVYRFILAASGTFRSDVTVSVAKKPNVILSCPSLITVNEGDNFTCVCRGEGENIAPANVTWYNKDGVQIGGRGKEEQILTLGNVSRTDGRIYTCIARSYFNEFMVLVKSIEVRSNYKPNVPTITFTPGKAVVGRPIVITCESEGVPEPSYTIINNDTVVSNCKTYTIRKVKWSDGGIYKCIVMNKLGRDSSSAKLIIEEAKGPPSTTFSPTTSGKKIRTTTENNKKDKTLSNDSCTSCKTEWYIVVVSLVSGIIIGLFFSYIVWCSRRKFGSRKPQSIPEPQSQRTEVDTTYHQLDLSQMNSEDNYQSLRGNAARSDIAVNDDDSNYTELNNIRDMENNYQSLT